MRTEPNNQPPMSRPTGRLLVFFFLIMILGSFAGILYFYEPVKGEARFLGALGEVMREAWQSILGGEEEKSTSIVLKDKNQHFIPSEKKIEDTFQRVPPPKKISAKKVPAAGAVKINSGEHAAVSPKNTEVRECDFKSASGTPSRAVLISEIAWMGASGNAQAEWIELKNNSGNDLDLREWALLAEENRMRARFSIRMPAAGFHLLVREGFSGAGTSYRGALSNNGEWLKLVDHNCRLTDEIDARNGWGLYGGDNVSKRTLERNYADLGWHSSLNAGGTPGSPNAAGISAPPAEEEYSLKISIRGKGRVVSLGEDLECKTSCTRTFFPGKRMIFSALADDNYYFAGWTGICRGKASCEILLDDDVSFGAQFRKVIIEEGGEEAVVEPESSGPAPAAALLISEVMAGSDLSSSHEFIELYNPGENPVSLAGWSLKKISSTGVESVLVSEGRLEGKSVPPKGKFLIVNQGGYTGLPAPGATWPASYTLAYSNNTIVLLNPSGGQADSIFWTDIPKNKSLHKNPEGEISAGEPSPESSG